MLDVTNILTVIRPAMLKLTISPPAMLDLSHLTINYREVCNKAQAVKIQFFFSIADSDPGTGSTGYREVCDKAQAVRTHN